MMSRDHGLGYLLTIIPIHPMCTRQGYHVAHLGFATIPLTNALKQHSQALLVFCKSVPTQPEAPGVHHHRPSLHLGIPVCGYLPRQGQHLQLP